MERCVLFERCELAPSHERDRCLERKGNGRSKCNSMIYIDLSVSFKVCVLGLPSSNSHRGDNFYCSKRLSERIKMAKVQGPRHEDTKIWPHCKGFNKMTDE